MGQVRSRQLLPYFTQGTPVPPPAQTPFIHLSSEELKTWPPSNTPTVAQDLRPSKVEYREPRGQAPAASRWCSYLCREDGTGTGGTFWCKHPRRIEEKGHVRRRVSRGKGTASPTLLCGHRHGVRASSTLPGSSPQPPLAAQESGAPVSTFSCS